MSTSRPAPIKPEHVIGVLLGNAWHIVDIGSFTVGPLVMFEKDNPVGIPFGKTSPSDSEVMGFTCWGTPEATRGRSFPISGPLSSLQAVRTIISSPPASTRE